jgi:hypothetical protein
VLPDYESYLDTILDSFSRNESLEHLKLSYDKEIPLKLCDSNSLKFIEKNSTLRSLHLNNIQFSKDQMTMLSQLLMKNDTFTELNFSNSNFEGPFEFLKKKNLKKFKHSGSWEILIGKEDGFLHFLEFNTSLKDLELRFQFNNKQNLKEVERLNYLLMNHESIKVLCLENIENSKTIGNLLLNSNLKELHLLGSLSNESLIIILNALNENHSLILLDISYNIFFIHSNWDDIKITNRTLQTVHMIGNSTLT